MTSPKTPSDVPDQSEITTGTGAHESLLGRSRQSEQLAGLLSGELQATYLRAAAGSGKTALLDELSHRATAAGWSVVRCTATPAEKNFPFAALAHVVLPLRAHLSELTPPAREALDTALGMATGPASVMALGVAVLDLLASSAPQAGLLLVLDDEQWIDAPSAEVLSFVTRRLAGLAVAVAVAARDGHPNVLDVSGFDRVDLPPLNADASAELLRRACPGLAEATVSSVSNRAAGNPLALIELGTYAWQKGGDVEAVLPDRVEHMFADRIRELPEFEANELLLMALDVRSGLNAAYRPTHVEQATVTRLVIAASGHTSGGNVRFSHPLVADVVVQLATPNQIRQAHNQLAERVSQDIERSAHHRAAAAIDPDESIARALDSAAQQAIRRGGAAAAVDWLARAAELSPAVADGQRRMRDAAFVASQSGLLDLAESLAGRSGRHSSTAATPTTALTDAFIKFYRQGALSSARRVVVNALTRHADGLDDVSVARFANILLAIGTYAAEGEVWQTIEETLSRFDSRLSAMTGLLIDTWGDASRRGPSGRAEIDGLLAAATADAPWDITRLLISAYYVDLLAEHRHLLDRVVQREGAAGAVANEVTGLNLLVKADIAAGNWDNALAHIDRGLHTTRQHGFQLFEHHFLVYQAEMSAHRGDFDVALRLQNEVERWARPRGVGILTQHVDVVGVAVGLASGDYETAWQFANGLTATGTFRRYAHQARRGVLDHVEAALATGRIDAARTHAVAARAAGLADLTPRLDMLVTATEALTSDDDPAVEQLYDRANNHDAAGTFVFDSARIKLNHGMWLRRRHRISEAESALARAQAMFDHLGARPWASLSEVELALCRPRGGAGESGSGSLTAQEHQIAELAASGLSNKQIGAQLYLSPRTVSTHLYRIYPKLGIGSRASLRDALSTQTGTGSQS